MALNALGSLSVMVISPDSTGGQSFFSGALHDDFGHDGGHDQDPPIGFEKLDDITLPDFEPAVKLSHALVRVG